MSVIQGSDSNNITFLIAEFHPHEFNVEMMFRNDNEGERIERCRNLAGPLYLGSAVETNPR
jgi:hypothetical protein